MSASAAHDAAITAESPAVFEVPVPGSLDDEIGQDVPAHRISDLAHGPDGRLRRAAAATISIAVVALAVPAVALLGGLAADGALWPALAANAAWFVLAAGIALGSNGVTSLQALRPTLAAGQIVVVALAVLFAVGVPVPALRSVLLIVLTTTVIATVLRVIGTRLFHARTVLVTPTHLLTDAMPADTSAVLGVENPASPDSVHLAEAAVRAVDETQADVVRVSGDLPQSAISEISWALRSRNVPVQVDLLDGTVRHSRLRGSADAAGVSVLVAPPLPSRWSRVAKRSMDVVGSGLLLLLLSPLLLGTALAIRIDDRGPIMFRQVRIGKDGEPFEIFKFRTMAVDADARLQELLARQNSAGTPLFKVQDDPRITRIGGFLRRYSIDELPQLFNVFFGTMSLVGPRPQREAEVALYTGTDAHRLGVTPGMTGLWQVSGRSNLSWEEARRLDVHYAHNWNLTLDIVILLRTVRAVLAKDGAV